MLYSSEIRVDVSNIYMKFHDIKKKNERWNIKYGTWGDDKSFVRSSEAI